MTSRVLFVLTVCFLVFAFSSHQFQNASDEESSSISETRNLVAEHPQSANDYGNIPLHFEQNTGQTDDIVKFLSRGKGYAVFLTENQAVLSLQKDGKQSALQMRLIGANTSPEIKAENQLEGKTNYLRGNDPKDWKTDIANFQRVRYENSYDGVDVVFYGNQEKLEYDFVVQPNANPGKIALKFEGADDLEIAGNGDLILKFDGGELLQHKPIVYQEINGERLEITSNYLLSTNQIKFEIGDYDHNQPLVIDPVLSYSTFLGGTGGESGRGIAVDANGNAYVGGFTNSTSQFPLVGAFQTVNPNGVNAAFVTKINSAGTAFVYSTYLTGTSGVANTVGRAIAVDTAGSAYLTGITQSCNFPTTAGVFLPAGNPGCAGNYKGFVAKFNAAGNGLVYGTFIADQNYNFNGEITGIVVDSTNNAYLTGFADTPTFPTTAGAFRPAPVAGSGNDSFVVKLNPAGSGLAYSTFLGGGNTNLGDAFGLQSAFANSIALDSANNTAVVAGHTTATNFPIAGSAAQPFYSGLRDGFVTKLNSTGTGIIYSTYLGGSDRDGEPANVALDSSGNAYVSVSTSSQNFPVTPTAFRPFRDGNSFSAALTKLNANGGLVYSTFVGAGDNDIGVTDVAVDAGGNAYVAGGGGTTTIHPVNSLFPSGRTFVSKFNSTGTGLFFGNYLDGTNTGESIIRSITLDSNGNAFLTGNTSVTNFPNTAGAPQTVNRGGGSSQDDAGDAFVSRVNLLGNDCPAITINPQPLRLPIRGQNYNQQLTATGGTAPYTFSMFPNVSQNQLPQATTLSAAGLISGSIGGIGGDIRRAAIRATDATGCVGVRPYFLRTFNGIRPFDFDGDYRSDISLFRPSTGIWYRLDSFRNVSFNAVQFGTNGDIPTAGDFDGDGNYDISIFRPSDGNWWRIESLTGIISVTHFGVNGDIPTVGDFDGDGRSDIAVYRPSDGTWYLSQSQAGFAAVRFGLNGDRPVVGDYDGDGKSDICVFRPSGGDWYRLNSSNGAFAVTHFGSNGDIPVRGDFNGQGQSDIAVFRPSTGIWYFLFSENGQFSATQFGLNGDIPVSSDYDGDGFSDIAVYRPSSGIWYIYRSSFGSILITQFGLNADVPIPALP